MKNFINSILAIVAPLTSAPTAWAIFAGITNRPIFPINDFIAAVGAVAILLVDVAVALLMVDAYQFKQSSIKEESKMVQPLWWSLVILMVAIASEIFLSLFIVVVKEIQAWGVLVFPLMTLAGAFTVAARIDLTERQNVRENLREEKQKEKKAKAEKARESRTRRKREQIEEEAKLAKEKAEFEKAEAKRRKLEALKCGICGYQAESKKQLAGHMRAHPISERGNHRNSEEEFKKTELMWTCFNCKTVNNREREVCRECGKEKSYVR